MDRGGTNGTSNGNVKTIQGAWRRNNSIRKRYLDTTNAKEDIGASDHKIHSNCMDGNKFGNAMPMTL
jgi:hypothetical protein